MGLDKLKIEEILSRQGLSTKRSRNLAAILAKEDLTKEDEKPKKKEKSVIRNITEVKKED